MKRVFDIEPVVGEKIQIEIDGCSVSAEKGETVLAVLGAVGIKEIGKNDHGMITGAYCGMGVCYCCMVSVNGKQKQRACRTVVQEGMVIRTCSNYFEEKGIHNGAILTKGTVC